MAIPDPNWSVYTATVNGLVQTATMLQLPVDELLLQVGIDRGELEDSSNRFAVSKVTDLYDAIVAASGNDDVGLYAGRIMYIDGLNLQLYMSTVCQTFRQYLNVIPSLLRFAGDIGEVKICREGDYIRLNWMPLWEGSMSHRFLADEVLANSAAIVDSLCIQPIKVIRACFTYPEPEDTSLLRTLFGDDLSFNQPVSCLYYPRESLDYPITKTGFDLNQAVTQQVGHLFTDEAQTGDAFLRELRDCVVKLLPSGEVSIDAVATELNVSRRTLQRRLSDRNTQYSEVLQAVRSELALNYLADQRLGITDIAFLLGYGDQSSFSSAFKSWYGKSPRDYRQK